MHEITDVTAAVITRAGRVLLVRRGPGERLAGYWEFPGGKIRPGETPQACLERELAEELGLSAEAGEVLAVSEHRYEHATIRLIAMRARVGGGDPELTCHDRAEWVAPGDLERYPLAPADVPIAARLRAEADG